ncbi:MAG TPA: recombination protein NinG [Polyangiaceae bacterium]|nr:recombination protein NinG [Polyangiaceae bacterium]
MTGPVIKPKRCRRRVCGKEFTPRSTLEKFCSFDCAAAEVPKIVRRGQLKRTAAARKEKREYRARTMTIGKLLQGAQREYNRYVVQRDHALGCISCHMPPDYGGQWQAGHYRTTKAASHLRFNEDNVHKQCAQCNGPKSGNIVEYRKGLVARIGIERVEALENDNRTAKWDRDELVAIRRKYLAKWKSLRAAREAKA